MQVCLFCGPYELVRKGPEAHPKHAGERCGIANTVGSLLCKSSPFQQVCSCTSVGKGADHGPQRSLRTSRDPRGEAGQVWGRGHERHCLLFPPGLSTYFNFFNVYLFILRQRATEQWRGRERGETENPKRAPCCQHGAQ